MVIRELKPSQHVAGRWLAVLEDGTILRVGENEVLEFGLYAGRTLTDEEAEAIQAAARKSARREKALSYAGGKPTSRRDLERKLEQWGADEAEQQAVCDRLEELGVLNDEQYGALVVRHYAAKGYGAKKIRDELYRRGVPRELWADALAQLDDPAETLDRLVAARLKGQEPTREALKKVSDHLARRGFGWQDISAALRRYGAEGEFEE